MKVSSDGLLSIVYYYCSTITIKSQRYVMTTKTTLLLTVNSSSAVIKSATVDITSYELHFIEVLKRGQEVFCKRGTPFGGIIRLYRATRDG